MIKVMGDNLAKGLQRWYPIIVLAGSALISIGAGKATAALMATQVAQNAHDIIEIRRNAAAFETMLARIEERLISIQDRLNRREGRDAK